MAVKSRRSYQGKPVSNTLGSQLLVGGTSISLAATMSGWPTSAEPFFCVIDAGTAKEEKVCVVYATTTTLTVVDPADYTSPWGASANGRGVDNTTAYQHEAGAVIYPCITAREMDEANELVSKYASQGAVVYQGASTFTELAIGTAGQVLKVNSGATAPEWGQVVASNIATATLKLLCPVGTIVSYSGASAPTGWLLCDGTAISGSYTELIALVGANTPDLRARVPMGKAASGTGSTLLGTGGARKIASSNLPTHAHALDHDHAAFNYTHDHGAFSTGSDGSHSHAVSDPGHSHNYLRPTESTYNVVNAADSSLAFIDSYTIASVDSNSTGISVSTTNSTHQHSIDVPSHTGSIDIPGFTGTVTTSFANDDYFQPFVAVNYIIKHDY